MTIQKRSVPFIIQAAGVLDSEEAAMLASCGATHLGFPLGPGVRTPDLDAAGVARVAASLPAHATGVLITYLDTAAAVRGLARSAGLRAVQLHGRMDPSGMAALRRLEPGWFLIKSLVVGRTGRDELMAAMRAAEPHVDAFLTDTYDPATGASGATGRVHDWSVSAALVRASSRPVILAGGLGPDNVAEAVETVRPAGVDAHTGLEGRTGRKDEARVRRFVAETLRAVASFSEAL